MAACGYQAEVIGSEFEHSLTTTHFILTTIHGLIKHLDWVSYRLYDHRFDQFCSPGHTHSLATLATHISPISNAFVTPGKDRHPQMMAEWVSHHPREKGEMKKIAFQRYRFSYYNGLIRRLIQVLAQNYLYQWQNQGMFVYPRIFDTSAFTIDKTSCTPQKIKGIWDSLT